MSLDQFEQSSTMAKINSTLVRCVDWLFVCLERQSACFNAYITNSLAYITALQLAKC